MALLQRREKRRYCKVCGKKLPLKNWNYCNECKKIFYEEEEIETENIYTVHLEMPFY